MVLITRADTATEENEETDSTEESEWELLDQRDQIITPRTEYDVEQEQTITEKTSSTDANACDGATYNTEVVPEESTLSKHTVHFDTMPSLNSDLMSGPKMFEMGYNTNLTHDNTAFNGLTHHITNEKIPLIKETDFWYCYFILARTEAEAKQKAASSDYQKIMYDTGANRNLATPKYDQFLTNKTKSKLSARGAFGNKLTRGSCSGDLHMWIMDGDNGQKCSMAFAGMTLSEFMRDALVQEESCAVGANKNLCGNKLKEMSAYEFHCMQGHMGFFKGCTICELVPRSLRRVKVDAVLHKELRIGYSMTMDAMVLSHRSYDGEKYAYVIRDKGPSSYHIGFTLVRRSDLVNTLFPIVKEFRSTYQGDHAHELFKELQLDCAGEHISAEFQETASKNGIIIMYGSDRKENMGLAEVTMQHTELGMKSIMLESCMDTGDWPSAFRARIFLVNRYPKIKDVKSRDGDASVAIEMMSNGRISRNTVHTELKHFCPPGRLAWVKNKKDIKGSNIDEPVRSTLAVSTHMVSGVMKWKHPEKGYTFRSNDYKLVQMPACTNYRTLLNMDFKVPTAALPRATDITLINDQRFVDITQIGVNTRSHADLEKITFDGEDESTIEETPGTGEQSAKSETEPTVSSGEQTKDVTDMPITPMVDPDYSEPETNISQLSHDQITALQHLHEQPEQFIDRTVFKTWEDNHTYEGCVIDVDDDNHGGKLFGIQWSDGSRSDMDINEMRKYCVLNSDGTKETGDSHQNDIEAVRRRLDQTHVQYYLTKENDTWAKLCNAMDIEYSKRKPFYRWLQETHNYGSINMYDHMPWLRFNNPYSVQKAPHKRTPVRFRKQVPIPYPCGGEWHQKTKNNTDKENGNQMGSIHATNIQMHENARHRMQKVYTVIDTAEDQAAAEFNHAIAEAEAETGEFSVSDATIYTKKHLAVLDVFSIAVAEMTARTGEFTQEQLKQFAKLKPPKNPKEAYQREDAELWKAAERVELAAFDRFKVMRHNVTQQDLDNDGITGRPVPMRFIYSVKLADDGTYLKHKARLILQGHAGYITSGKYDETYAPTPDNFCNMFFAALALTMGMVRDAFDVCTAYLQSDQKYNECGSIIVEYPRGREPSCNSKGEKYYGVMLKPVYGHPKSARAWSKTITNWIIEFFDTQGWTVGTLMSESCAFVLLSPDNTYSLLSVHTDDVEVHSEREEDAEYIRRSFGDKFGISRTDPRFMLGVLKEITVLPDGSSIMECSQPEFCEALIDDFKEHITYGGQYETPWMPGCILEIKADDYNPSPTEQKKYKDLGYLSLAGSLLWLSRRCYPNLLFATSQLCSVMSMPSEHAWNQAIRVLTWLRDNYKVGIAYHSNGNLKPKMFYDSSHNMYKSDSKAHYGTVSVFAGGPIGAESKKQDDIGDSTAYNETMALYHCSRRCRYWYQLIKEMDNVSIKKGVKPKFSHMIDEPIPMYGDNDTATSNAKECRITPKNRHMKLKYFTIKEIIEDGHGRVERVPTEHNIADIPSKPTSGTVQRSIGMALMGRDKIWPDVEPATVTTKNKAIK